MSAAEASLLTLAAVGIGFIIGAVYASQWWKDDTPTIVLVVPEPPEGEPTPDFIPGYFFDQDAP